MGKLTNREIEVATLYAEGKTYKEIAKELFIGDWTVKQHLKKICEKVDLKPRPAMILLTINGLINPNIDN